MKIIFLDFDGVTTSLPTICLCGGTDIGVGVMHEPFCPLSGRHCESCGGHGLVRETGMSSDGTPYDEGVDCRICKGTGVRPTPDWAVRMIHGPVIEKEG